ncbi:hypothetical protein C6N75_09860 [Streptomyces solincola]|uniref:DUF7417 domain-containing protein n=1 Tax=Streptomyces solincola TaxID=2100817 RepID=A0A2S9PY91_9ACTN|nr:hypothetical protein [Streptomyces solincola]PRH79379.1 hypothetical protein C6N75_09860 [Streptomyces solincola]
MSEYPVTADELMAFEDGRLGPGEVIDMFQRLIDSGMAWRLQGSYGRTARGLIDAGYCEEAA